MPKEFYTNPFEAVIQCQELGKRLARLDSEWQAKEDAKYVMKLWEEKEKIEKPKRELREKLRLMAESVNNVPMKWRF